nr:ribonuclease H-like domain-containing protein [Tanacetum cinerariifolium]
MKMEQYLAHTDYALWEVILNGNIVVQMTKDEVGNEIEVPPVPAQQILARTRERKAESTLFMAIPDEHLARFHGIKDAKTLWAATKTRFGESTSRTNELNATYSVSTATGLSSQAQGSSSYVDELIRKLKFNGKEPVGFDKNMVECFKCHRRGHFARDCRSVRNSGNRSRDAENAGYKGRDNGKRPVKEEDEQALVVQDGFATYDWSNQVEEEATDFALMAFTSNPSSSSSSNSEREKLSKANIESKEEVTKTMFNNRSSDEENSVANDRFKKGEGYHAVPLPLTGNYMPPKPDLSFARLDDSIYKFKISDTVTSLAKDNAPETSTACVAKPKEDRFSAPLIED